jgi:hypothetical protein
MRATWLFESTTARLNFEPNETIFSPTIPGSCQDSGSFCIWGVTPDIAQSEQAFSDDGGKTWEVNWVTKYTRIKNPAG